MKTKETAVKKEKKPAKSALEVMVVIMQWVRRFILPYFAVIALAGLAIKGGMVYLSAIDERASLIASLMAVAFLLVATFGRE